MEPTLTFETEVIEISHGQCHFHYYYATRDPGSVGIKDFACDVVSYVKLHRRTAVSAELTLVLHLPEGDSQVVLSEYGSGLIPKTALKTASFRLAPYFKFMPPEDMQLDASAAHGPNGNSPPARLKIDGSACTYSVQGYGQTRCFLIEWKPDNVLAILNPAFFSSSDWWKMISIKKTTTGWSFDPPNIGPPGSHPDTISYADKDASLITAIQSRAEPALEDLILHGANVNTHDQHGNSALVLAIDQREIAAAVFLIDHGADANGLARGNVPVLDYTLGMGNRKPGEFHDVIVSLIAHGANVNHAGPNGETPLMAATATGQRDMVELLLAKGADVNATATGEFGDQPATAYDIAQHGLEMVKQLGFDQSPLTGSSVQNTRDIMALLVQHGAHVLPGTGLPAADGMHFVAGPDAGTVTLIGVPGAAVDGETVTVTDERTGAQAGNPVAKDGSFRVGIAGASADYYSVRLSNSVKKGNAVYLHGNDPALMVKVDPISAGPELAVTGTYAGPLNTGITVGDRPAILYKGRFAANAWVQPGMKSLVITARTLGGLAYVQQVPLNLTGTRSPLLFQIFVPDWGMAPYDVSFGVRLDNGLKIQTVKISSLSDGKDDIVTSDPLVISANEAGSGGRGNGALKHTYTAPGLYKATATVTDTAGKVYQAEQWVLVQDANSMDAMFNRLWRDLADSLASGDRDAAMQMQWEDGHRSPAAALDDLLGPSKKLLQVTTPLVREEISNGQGPSYENEASYHLVIPGDTRQFPWYDVRFIMYPDGIWRVNMLF